MAGFRIIREDEIGKVYGKYEVLDVFTRKGRSYFSVICTEGHTRDVRTDSLKISSHLCFECDKRNSMYKTREYNSWDSMIQRCTNTRNSSYYKYGAVGISVFDEWLLPDGVGFRNFYEHVGDCPEGMTLDRWPDKFGNYEPGNVRWATNSEQGYNQKRRNTNKSGRTGVHWDKSRDKWVVSITFHNRTITLGRYVSYELACFVREEAELKYFGEVKE